MGRTLEATFTTGRLGDEDAGGARTQPENTAKPHRPEVLCHTSH